MVKIPIVLGNNDDLFFAESEGNADRIIRMSYDDTTKQMVKQCYPLSSIRIVALTHYESDETS